MHHKIYIKYKYVKKYVKNKYVKIKYIKNKYVDIKYVKIKYKNETGTYFEITLYHIIQVLHVSIWYKMLQYVYLKSSLFKKKTYFLSPDIIYFLCIKCSYRLSSLKTPKVTYFFITYHLVLQFQNG